MLSEFIRSVHSYSTLPLAGQQTHQRYVQLGPLVAYNPLNYGYIIPLSLGAQTISSPFFSDSGVGILQVRAVVFKETIPHRTSPFTKVNKSLRGQT